MYANASAGTQASRRDRSGWGRRPTFSSSQRDRSWSATRWHAQPQNQRPKRAVIRMAAAKKIRPALTTPPFENAIASEGSTGVTVLPARNQWAMWAAIRTWTAIRLAARHFERREGRILRAGGSEGRTGRRLATA